VDTELSGNIIDLCPVGALTSKPFRFSARTWELSRRKSVSPHDGLGSNLIVQTKHDKVMRVLPLENEDINECWLADKERFSYQGLNSAERLTKPMVKQGGEWKEVDWNVALDYAAHALRDVAKTHGGRAIGGLAEPACDAGRNVPAQKAAARPGQREHRFPSAPERFLRRRQACRHPVAGHEDRRHRRLDRVLVVGSFLRKDHPLIAQRLRQSAKKGAQVSILHSADDDLLIKLAARAIVAPSQLPRPGWPRSSRRWPNSRACGRRMPHWPASPPPTAQAIAESLASGQQYRNPARQLRPAASAGGDPARAGRQLATLLGGKLRLPRRSRQQRRRICGQGRAGCCRVSTPPHAQGSAPGLCGARRRTGTRLRRWRPGAGALTKAAVCRGPDPVQVAGHARLRRRAAAGFAVLRNLRHLRQYRRPRAELLAAAKPLGEARPAWKVLRVLGNLLGWPASSYNSSEDVRAKRWAASRIRPASTTASNGVALNLTAAAGGIERVADVPIHFADPLVRALRRCSLQPIPRRRRRA
jgi:NADH-quinone oxidoreductase subunit G